MNDYSKGRDYRKGRDYSRAELAPAPTGVDALAEMQANPGFTPQQPAPPKPAPVVAPTIDQTLGAVGGPVGANPYAGGDDWRASLSPDEAWIIKRESGFNPNARNPTSGAFGIWQGLGSTLKSYTSRNGYALHTTNPLEQLNMFRQYVGDRYGNAAEAVKFWQRNGWY